MVTQYVKEFVARIKVFLKIVAMRYRTESATESLLS